MSGNMKKMPIQYSSSRNVRRFNKMEEQADLTKVTIGNIEETTVTAKPVKIVKATVELVGDKGNSKVVCECKHPDKEDTIKISGVKYLKKDKLETSGLWFNQDKDFKIRKGSALAATLTYFGCANVFALNGRELPTVEDDSGYLVFKAY